MTTAGEQVKEYADKHLGDGGTESEPLLLTWADYKLVAEKEPAGGFIIPNLYRRGAIVVARWRTKKRKIDSLPQHGRDVGEGGSVLGYMVPAVVAVYLPLQEDPRTSCGRSRRSTLNRASSCSCTTPASRWSGTASQWSSRPSTRRC